MPPPRQGGGLGWRLRTRDAVMTAAFGLGRTLSGIGYEHLGPSVVASRLGVAVVIVVSELEALFDLGVKSDLMSVR